MSTWRDRLRTLDSGTVPCAKIFEIFETPHAGVEKKISKISAHGTGEKPREPGEDDADPTPAWTGSDVLLLEIFPGARVVTSTDGEPTAAGLALFEAARAAGFPWLRLRPGVAVARGEDAWWLFVGTASRADLEAARRALARGAGIA